MAEPLGKLMLRALPRDNGFDLVIAMPMHWRKRWERGFNQAELLAEVVASRYGQKLSTQLYRTKRTKTQASLSEAQRLDNLSNSFGVRNADQIRGKRILLVDDVFTTGATLRAATTVLKATGARHVAALVLARVDRRAADGNISSSLPLRVSNAPVAAGENRVK